jgi:glucuronoarabinoxylan endo-1,4-beta-xylanase
MNPGFENGAVSWSGRGCTIAVDTTEKHAGTFSAKTIARTDTWQGIKQSLLGKLENGKTYHISAWVKLENSDSNKIQLTVAQADMFDSSYIRIADVNANSKTWTYLAGDFTLSYKGSLTTLDVYFEGPSAGVDFAIDDINFFGPPAPPPKPLDKNAVVRIKTSKRFQIFEGFGAAGGYDPNWLTNHPKKDELYKLMFADLGIDIYRIQNQFGIDGNYMINTAEIINAANKIRHQPLKVMIASWSPPPVLKSTNNLTGGTLRKTDNGEYMYNQFADWWLASLKALASSGVNVEYLSIQNECDIETNYESCKFMPTEDANWAGYNLALEAVYYKLHKQMPGRMPKILAPETMGFGRSRPYIDAIIDSNHVYAWTHHLYSDGTGGYENPDGYVAALRKFAARYNNKPLFQTEYSRNPDFNDAIFTARHIQNCLEYENLASYCYWSLFRKGTIGGGLITLDVTFGSSGYKVNKTYYAFKQFSSFIAPHWQRVSTEVNSPVLRTTAFVNPENTKISVVIINIADTDINLELSAVDFKIKTAAVYRTSQTENCVHIGNFANSIVLPAASITTIVLVKE